ncbi:hypothetical protein BWI15_28515 [Kribbella sp. ALI-6-A]|uniref:YbaB/EbfC family nucleoid-associated protein n=1 Tax=Kribbella sp. ALI-6-A TaxID=1933817 RepID=UPI00097BC660|nr:YbaB/EbfC family nucleoid-associated protein [Kribbella sp. ALI-6-A]ONI67114.1 hypothetical protein BWI15_28515 [Kribbella sp. ALI-6-A]
MQDLDSGPRPPRLDHERLRTNLLTVQQELGRVRATADSDDGLVSATVGGRGELLDLVLDPRIYRSTDSTALAETILGTVRDAVELAADEAFELTRDVLSAKATRDRADLAFDPLLEQLDRGGRP